MTSQEYTQWLKGFLDAVDNYSITKKQLAVFENTIINNANFKNFKEKPMVKPTKLKAYDPSFWEGHNIVEPNQAIKDFKSLE